MDIRSLRYFVETVRLGSFTEAARALGVTQSTISKMIRQLEDETGDPLLLRDSRPLRLTDTGRVLYDRGREILLAVQRLEIEIRETQAVARGSLALGMPPMINMLFTGALKAFRESYPGIELNLLEHTGREIEQQVASGELASGMTVLPLEAPEGLSVARVASHRVWAVGTESMLKTTAETVSLRTVAQLPLVIMKDDFAITRMLRRHFARGGFEPRVAAQSAQWDWTLAMARAGMGVALLPQPFVERINRDGLSCKPISQPDILWEIGLLWNPRHASHALQAWLDICRKHLGGDWPEPPASENE